MADRKELVTGAKVRGVVPTSMEEAFRLATAIVASGMAPPDVKTQEGALVIILTGLEVGMPPMQAIQRIALINGRTTIWGDAAIGLVRASGLLDSIKEWQTPDGVAHCKVRRKGDKAYHESTFSKAEAQAAGLWDRKNRDGTPGMYQKYPKRMLQMRARGFALRDVFADVLGGMYLREELEGVDPEPVDITPPPAPTGPKPRPQTRGQRSAAAYGKAESPLVPGPEEGFDEEREAIGRFTTEQAEADAEDGNG